MFTKETNSQSENENEEQGIVETRGVSTEINNQEKVTHQNNPQ